MVSAHSDRGSKIVNMIRGTVGNTAVIFACLGVVNLDDSYIQSPLLFRAN